MDSTEALKTAFLTEREAFLSKLGSYALVDIGTIDEFTEDGRARVVSSTFIQGRPVVYEDAEVIYPGNGYGTYATACSGNTCLIFIPRSCMPDTDDQKLRLNAPAYNRDGVKALPIGNGSQNIVKQLIHTDGTFETLTGKYSLQYTEDSVCFQRSDGTTVISIDGEGQCYLQRQTDKGTLNLAVEKSGATKEWVSEDGKVRWKEEYKPDGSMELRQDNPENEQANPYVKLSIDKTGAITIKLAKTLTFETSDALVLKGKSVSVESTNGGVDITTSAGQKFTVNGTNLEVEK